MPPIYERPFEMHKCKNSSILTPEAILGFCSTNPQPEQTEAAQQILNAINEGNFQNLLLFIYDQQKYLRTIRAFPDKDISENSELFKNRLSRVMSLQGKSSPNLSSLKRKLVEMDCFTETDGYLSGVIAVGTPYRSLGFYDGNLTIALVIRNEITKIDPHITLRINALQR
jgi:hypothetical protein